jgi:hypothetical protein
LLARLLFDRALQERHVKLCAVQRVTDLVREACGQRADGGQLLRLAGALGQGVRVGQIPTDGEQHDVVAGLLTGEGQIPSEVSVLAGAGAECAVDPLRRSPTGEPFQQLLG